MEIFRNYFTVLLVAALAFPQILPAKENNKSSLIADIKQIEGSLNGKIGVAVTGLDFKDSFTFNGNNHFPMQSVFKFPLALYILSQVDKGALSLTQKIHISKEELDANTWSPMVKDFPNRAIDITLTDLLIYTVSKSDNNGCDALFRLAGGTTVVNNYIHSLGVKGIAIMATEAGMKKSWEVQYTNWCRPTSMLQLLQIFYTGKALSKTSNDFLIKIMTESDNSPKRLKGLLPPNTVVAHKTGTSDTNDVGIITLPDGRHYAIVVFVSDYKGGVECGERAIAHISKLVWRYFTEK